MVAVWERHHCFLKPTKAPRHLPSPKGSCSSTVVKMAPSLPPLPSPPPPPSSASPNLLQRAGRSLSRFFRALLNLARPFLHCILNIFTLNQSRPHLGSTATHAPSRQHTMAAGKQENVSLKVDRDVTSAVASLRLDKKTAQGQQLTPFQPAVANQQRVGDEVTELDPAKEAEKAIHRGFMNEALEMVRRSLFFCKPCPPTPFHAYRNTIVIFRDYRRAPYAVRSLPCFNLALLCYGRRKAAGTQFRGVAPPLSHLSLTSPPASTSTFGRGKSLLSGHDILPPP